MPVIPAPAWMRKKQQGFHVAPERGSEKTLGCLERLQFQPSELSLGQKRNVDRGQNPNPLEAQQKVLRNGFDRSTEAQPRNRVFVGKM